MTEPTSKDALARLKPSSTAAKVRALMPEIERQLANGVPYADIVAALNKSGLNLAPRNFESILYRYRKKHGANTAARPAEQATAGAVAQPLATNPTPAPADLKPAAPAQPEADEIASDEASLLAKERAEKEAIDRVFDPKTRYKTADIYMQRPPRPLGTTPRKK